MLAAQSRAYELGNWPLLGACEQLPRVLRWIGWSPLGVPLMIAMMSREFDSIQFVTLDFNNVTHELKILELGISFHLLKLWKQVAG